MPDPRARLAKIRRGLSPAEWARFGGMVAAVVGLHVLGWVMLTAALSGHYHISKTTVFGVGTGALAYTLGMRHAFDADHIAAIDNTTRKLVNEGKRPLSVGFFFSLGHSSVVFALAVLLNFGIRDLDDQVRNGNSSCPDLPHEPDLPRKWDAGALLGAAGRRPRTGLAVAAAHTTLRHPDPLEPRECRIHRPGRPPRRDMTGGLRGW